MKPYLFSKRSPDPVEPASARRVSSSPLGDRLNELPSARSLAQLKTSLNGQGNASPKPNRTGLPDDLKAGVETFSGVSMDDVRVYRNSPQPTQLSALAYAQGSDIHLGPGQEQHLPHEAWHVVQQKQGRVAPTTQAKGMPINDDPSLEREADRIGERLERIGAVNGPAPVGSGSLVLGSPQSTVQRVQGKRKADAQDRSDKRRRVSPLDDRLDLPGSGADRGSPPSDPESTRENDAMDLDDAPGRAETAPSSLEEAPLEFLVWNVNHFGKTNRLSGTELISRLGSLSAKVPSGISSEPKERVEREIAWIARKKRLPRVDEIERAAALVYALKAMQAEASYLDKEEVRKRKQEPQKSKQKAKKGSGKKAKREPSTPMRKLLNELNHIIASLKKNYVISFAENALRIHPGLIAGFNEVGEGVDHLGKSLKSANDNLQVERGPRLKSQKNTADGAESSQGQVEYYPLAFDRRYYDYIGYFMIDSSERRTDHRRRGETQRWSKDSGYGGMRYRSIVVHRLRRKRAPGSNTPREANRDKQPEIWYGIVHTTPEGSEFERSEIYGGQLESSIPALVKMAGEEQPPARLVIGGDYYVASEALVKKPEESAYDKQGTEHEGTPNELRNLRETKEDSPLSSSFNFIGNLRNVELRAAVTGTNANGMGLQVADFFLTSRELGKAEAGLLDPRTMGARRLESVDKDISPFMLALSDHLPVYLAATDPARKDLLSNLFISAPRAAMEEEQRYWADRPKGNERKLKEFDASLFEPTRGSDAVLTTILQRLAVELGEAPLAIEVQRVRTIIKEDVIGNRYAIDPGSLWTRHPQADDLKEVMGDHSGVEALDSQKEKLLEIRLQEAAGGLSNQAREVLARERRKQTSAFIAQKAQLKDDLVGALIDRVEGGKTVNTRVPQLATLVREVLADRRRVSRLTMEAQSRPDVPKIGQERSPSAHEYDPYGFNNCLITAINQGRYATRAQTKATRDRLASLEGEGRAGIGEFLEANVETIQVIASALDIGDLRLEFFIGTGSGQEFARFDLYGVGDVLIDEYRPEQERFTWNEPILRIENQGNRHFAFSGLRQA